MGPAIDTRLKAKETNAPPEVCSRTQPCVSQRDVQIMIDVYQPVLVRQSPLKFEAFLPFQHVRHAARHFLGS